MRLFFLTPGLELGGAERWIVEMCRVLSDFEIAGVWPLNNHAHPDILADLRALKVPIILPGERVDCDAIISWGIPYPRKYVGPTCKPLVVVSHGAWPDAPADFFASQAWEATHIAAVSKAAAAGFDAKHDVRVLYNGVPVERIQPTEPEGYWRQRWRIEPDEKVVLQVGRISHEKRPDRLLQIVQSLPIDWVPVFCGRAIDSHQKEFLGSLVETAKTMGRKVVFQEPVKNVGSVYQAADVVCVPSNHEGMPLVVIEAWMAGKPVVCTKFPFAEEMIERHGNILAAVEPDAPMPEWAKTICQAAETDGETLSGIQNLACEEYSAAAMGNRWREFLLGEVLV